MRVQIAQSVFVNIQNIVILYFKQQCSNVQDSKSDFQILLK